MAWCAVAFVRLAFFPDGTSAHYGALAAELVAAPAPAERLLFAAGPVDGGWQVVQVWHSRAALDAYNEAVLVPALRRLGERAFPRPPLVTDLEPTDLDLRRGETGRDGTQKGLRRCEGRVYRPSMRLR